MIPRTVLMAQEVSATLTAPQEQAYGNIILNGYASSTLGVSTAGAVGSIATVTISNAGTNYTDGTYTGVYLGGSNGSFAYATITVAGNAVTVAVITAGGQEFAVGDVISLGSIPRTTAGTAATLTVATVDQYTVTPALKGWTNNYQEYYTRLQPNAYGVNPGDPTMFEYNVHSFTQATGVITALGVLQSGDSYTPGLYTNVATFGGSGTGATLNLTVDSDGFVTVATLNNPGTGYTAGDGLGTLAIGPGQKFAVAVATTTTVTTPNRSKWAQPPHRLINNAVAPENPPAYNSQANPYSAVLYPVADREDAPPIDSLG